MSHDDRVMFTALMRSLHMKSVVCFPVGLGSTPDGVITVIWTHPHEVNIYDEKVLSLASAAFALLQQNSEMNIVRRELIQNIVGQLSWWTQSAFPMVGDTWLNLMGQTSTTVGYPGSLLPLDARPRESVARYSPYPNSSEPAGIAGISRMAKAGIRAVRRLQQYDEMHEGQLVLTARTLVMTNSAREACERLFIHPNTLRYRIKKLEQLTGLNWDYVWHRMVLTLGLLANGIIEEKEAQML